jgi:V-type H+-transporting ATPase subunit C
MFGTTGLPCSPVVPGSLLKVMSDGDTNLYLMTVLKSQQERTSVGDIDSWSLADSFLHSCRKRRVTIREFDVDPRRSAASRSAKSKLDSDYLHYEGKTLDWCKVHYGEAVVAWGHVKAIRVHVESVLRYGLPPKFVTVLMVPKSGKEKKLRDKLKELYGHLEESGMDDDGGGGGGGGPNMLDNMGEYYPYVRVAF